MSGRAWLSPSSVVMIFLGALAVTSAHAQSGWLYTADEKGQSITIVDMAAKTTDR